MKKFILLLFLCLFTPTVAQGLTIDNVELKPLELEQVLEFNRPEGYNGIQGMAITNKYYVIAAYNSDDTNTALVIIDKKTKELAKLENNPVIDYNFGHANDMEYDSVTNELYIINDNKMHVLNGDTFKQIKEVTLPDNIKVRSIAKDNEGNYYFRNANTSYKYDADLKFASKFSVANLTGYQGVSYQNGKLYYSCYPKLTIEDEKVTNLIYIYDNEKLENILFPPNEYGELEALEFDNGIPYMLYWAKDKVGRIYVPVYKDVTVNLTVKDKTSDTIDATLSSGNKIIEQVQKENDKYTFSSLTFSTPGTYRYQIKKVSKTKESNTETINIEVKVEYDGAKNELSANVAYENDEFKKPVIETPKDEEQNKNENNTDKNNSAENNTNKNDDMKDFENPKTGFKIMYAIFAALGFVGIMNIYHKKKLYKL